MKLLLLLLLLLPSAQANLDAGEDVNYNGYIMHFGYSPEVPLAKEKIILAASLLNESTGGPAEYESVWIRISLEDAVLFSGTFDVQFGNTAFTYTFPETGNYEINVRFKNDLETLAENTFFLEVEGKTEAKSDFFQQLLMVNIVLLIIIAALLWRAKKMF